MRASRKTYGHADVFRGVSGPGLAVARVITLVVSLVTAALLLAILLRLLDARSTSDVVRAVYDVARWLAQPFEGAFDADRAKTRVLADWTLALVVYAVVGGAIARAISRVALRGG
jgi:hypothetical protein